MGLVAKTYTSKPTGFEIHPINGNQIFDRYRLVAKTYTPKCIGFICHSPPCGGVCEAYAIRPYTDGPIRGAYAIPPYMGRPICDAYAIRPYMDGRKFIKAGNVSRRGNEKKAEEESLPRPLRALIGEIRKL